MKFIFDFSKLIIKILVINGKRYTITIHIYDCVTCIVIERQWNEWQAKNKCCLVLQLNFVFFLILFISFPTNKYMRVKFSRLLRKRAVIEIFSCRFCYQGDWRKSVIFLEFRNLEKKWNNTENKTIHNLFF